MKVFFKPFGSRFGIERVLVVSPLQQDVRIVRGEFNGPEAVLLGGFAHFGRSGKRGKHKLNAGVFVVLGKDALERLVKPGSFLGAGRKLHDGLKKRGGVVSLFQEI